MMTSSEGPLFSLASGPPNFKPTTEYKDDNTAFHRSSALSGDAALLRAFCQWMSGRLHIKLEVQIVWKAWYWGTWLGARKMQAVCMKVVTSSSVAKPNFFGEAKYFEFKRETALCSGHCLSKHKMTRYASSLRGHGFLGPPVYACGCKEKQRTVLDDVQSSTDKKLAKTQDR